MLFQEDSTYCNILFQLFNKNIPKIRKVNLAEDIQTAFVFSQYRNWPLRINSILNI